MLTEIYIEALLVDEELADQVWEALDTGEIDDAEACVAWWLLSIHAAPIVGQHHSFTWCRQKNHVQ